MILRDSELAEEIAAMIGDSLYDMFNEYDGDLEMPTVENTYSTGHIAQAKLDDGRIITVLVTLNQTQWQKNIITPRR